MKLETFELIDRIEEFNLGAGKILAYGHVPKDSMVFLGHFPGYPLLPGVLLIEAMAQAAGWLLLARLDFKQMGVLAAVKEAKLRTAVSPDTELAVEGEIIHEGSGYAMVKGKILIGKKAVAEAEMTLRTLPIPNKEFAAALHKRARELGLMVQA
jgi:3-hydroxyacyl-[acyl-carrier-protein] dehydratase